jgi:hypothetical protein
MRSYLKREGERKRKRERERDYIYAEIEKKLMLSNVGL